MSADQEEAGEPVSNHVKYKVEMFNWRPEFHKDFQEKVCFFNKKT